MAKLTSTIRRRFAGAARPRKAVRKKRTAMRAGARRRLRRQSRRTPGKRGWRLALGKRLQRRTRPLLQPSRSGPLGADSPHREQALATPLPPPAEEAPSPPPAPDMAHGGTASDAAGIPHPPPDPVQAAAPQPADDTLWRQLLSRVPASYSLPDGVVVEALQHAFGR
ncbi:hypothetical protein ABD76_03030 [Paenibacillus dendritiformis]|uniref:hypothetical protein n=1 Tax=Paenibacillus dendritiformis TaxID=130049 RepID=UPI0018CE8D51|nr:hypothetical protein [Paenibacillus dendritiformis]MBG9791545.1 hypothetical protein [Paenibacillus dendritiformis]